MSEPERVVLVLDIGNTNTVVGVFRGDELVDRYRLATETARTADEYGALLMPLFQRSGLALEAAEAVVISSVVPPLHRILVELSRRFFGREPFFVDPERAAGLPIRYHHPEEVGADRIVNSLAARELYGAPVVVVDFGTATTFDVVNEAGEYLGGIIAPGLGISAEALFSHASRLYRVDVRRPERLVGDSTEGAMQSGLYYGYIGLVDGILERLLEEIPNLKSVVATGGQAELIAGGSKHIREVDADLTLIGLKLLHDRTR